MPIVDLLPSKFAPPPEQAELLLEIVYLVAAVDGLIPDREVAAFAAIAASGLPTEISTLGLNADGHALAAHMLHDKKMDAGSLPFVLLRGIGDAFLDKTVPLDDVAAFLDAELRR